MRNPASRAGAWAGYRPTGAHGGRGGGRDVSVRSSVLPRVPCRHGGGDGQAGAARLLQGRLVWGQIMDCLIWNFK